MVWLLPHSHNEKVFVLSQWPQPPPPTFSLLPSLGRCDTAPSAATPRYAEDIVSASNLLNSALCSLLIYYACKAFSFCISNSACKIE